jgi:CRISPR-associated protein Csb1
MREVIRERLALSDDTPLAPRDIARAVFALDPLCLIHGVFFAESAKIWPGQPRIARAVTSFIEAVEVRAANSGGVKRDEVRHQIGESGGATEGYGFVPYHRTEYTAARIQASFALDLAQLRSYGLGDVATEMLATLIRWEIRSLLDGGLRLRTACDLAVVEPEITDRAGTALPSLADLELELRRLIDACGDLIGDRRPIEVVWLGAKKKRTAPESGDAADES